METKDKLIAKSEELVFETNRLCEYLNQNILHGLDEEWEDVVDIKLTKIKRLESEITHISVDKVPQIMEEYHKAKLREELIKFATEYRCDLHNFTNPEKYVDEYLKDK